MSGELVAVLRAIARERGEELSPLLETLVRENWLVATTIQRRREAALGGLTPSPASSSP